MFVHLNSFLVRGRSGDSERNRPEQRVGGDKALELLGPGVFEGLPLGLKAHEGSSLDSELVWLRTHALGSLENCKEWTAF